MKQKGGSSNKSLPSRNKGDDTSKTKENPSNKKKIERKRGRKNKRHLSKKRDYGTQIKLDYHKNL